MLFTVFSSEWLVEIPEMLEDEHVLATHSSGTDYPHPVPDTDTWKHRAGAQNTEGYK